MFIINNVFTNNMNTSRYYSLINIFKHQTIQQKKNNNNSKHFNKTFNNKEKNLNNKSNNKQLYNINK